VNKLVPVLLLMNTLLLGGVLAVLLLRPPGTAGESAEKPAAEKKADAEPVPAVPALGPVVRLPDFTVRLRNPETDRYARISIELELAGEKERETVTTYMPRLRDTLLAWLSDRTLEELSGSEGMEYMKGSMMRALDGVLPGRPVRAIYVADFVVQ
jgi:flagellar FliL protein